MPRGACEDEKRAEKVLVSDRVVCLRTQSRESIFGKNADSKKVTIDQLNSPP
jgi:hypothetical protein